jgi:hypothetical protein
VERGHRDSAVAALVRRGLQLIEEAIDDPDDAPTPDAVTPPLRAVNLLGARLYERLFIGSDELPATQQANI